MVGVSKYVSSSQTGIERHLLSFFMVQKLHYGLNGSGKSTLLKIIAGN